MVSSLTMLVLVGQDALRTQVNTPSMVHLYQGSFDGVDSLQFWGTTSKARRRVERL